MKKRLLIIALLLITVICLSVLPGVYAAWEQSLPVSGSITVL